MINELIRKAKRNAPKATSEDIAAASAAYKADDARIQAAFTAERDRACAEWCAKTSGTPREYWDLQHFDAVRRDRKAGV